MIYVPAPTGIPSQDQSNIETAFKQAAALSQVVSFPEGASYQQTTGFAVSVYAGVPRGILGNGATLKATTTGIVPLSICNPHGVREHFFVENLTIDGAKMAAQCLNVNGMQYASLSNLRLVNAANVCLSISGSKGYGVYYNEFSKIICRGGFYGWRWADNLVDYASEGSHIQGNKVSVCQVQTCSGGGAWLTGVQGSLDNCQIEGNGNVGLLLDNSIQFDLFSVYFENNFVNGTDTAIQIDKTATNVKRYGGQWDGRIIGAVANG